MKVYRAALVAVVALTGVACSPPQDAVDIRLGGPDDDSISWEEARPTFIAECEALASEPDADTCQCLFRLVRDLFDSVEEYAQADEAPPGFDAGARLCFGG